jgi:uncharacterized protein (DUF1697 family)
VSRWFAFLRAINVGGRTVKMDRLRGLFTEIGLEDVESFIASGNLVFAPPGTDGRALEAQVEAHLAEALGYEVATFVRTLDELARAAASDPFDGSTPARHYIGFARDAPEAAAIERIAGLETSNDRIRMVGRDVHWGCETASRDSPVSGAALERALGGPLTLRNRNTVDRLLAKYGDGAGA